MELSYLPVLREALEKFAETGTVLVELMEQYEKSGTASLEHVTLHDLQSIMVGVRTELENVNR